MLSRIRSMLRLAGPTTDRATQERTRSQWDPLIYGSGVPGLGSAMPGTFATYREMKHQPTIALVLASMRAMLKAPRWSVEAEDGVPDEVVKFIDEQFIPMKAAILNHAFTGIVYGFAGFEKLWEVNDGFRIKKLKPLLADVTAPLVDPTGTLVGIENQGVKLGLTKCWLWSHDGEADNPWGESLLENIRETAYRAWDDTFKKTGQYTTKGAGVIPVIQMPPGQSGNRNGGTEDNQKIAEQLLNHLATAKGVVMPNPIPEAAFRNPELMEFLRWSVTFLEAKSGHGSEFISLMDYHDKQIVRGLLYPERAIIEGHFGTKADASEHGDIVEEITEQRLADIMEDFNRDVVDDVLMANWGDKYIGMVKLVPGPLDDREKAFFRQFIKDITANPASLELAFQIFDVDAMLDTAGYPKAKQIVQAPEEMTPDDESEPEAPTDPDADPEADTDEEEETDEGND